MNILRLVVIGALLGSGFAPASAPTSWFTMSSTSLDGREDVHIEISTVEISNPAGALPEISWIDQKTERYWLAKRTVARAGGSGETEWADSRTCYTLIETLATLVDLDRPASAPLAKVVDGPVSGRVYSVSFAGLTSGRAGEVRLIDGRSASVHMVVQKAFASLASCWRSTPPAVQTGR